MKLTFHLTLSIIVPGDAGWRIFQENEFMMPGSLPGVGLDKGSKAVKSHNTKMAGCSRLDWKLSCTKKCASCTKFYAFV
jgi:hypothetical protein